MFQHSLPIRRIREATKIGLQFSRQDPQSGRLADTVGANESEHLSWTGGWKTVQLERVGGIPMRHFGVQVCWQVNDIDGAKGTLLGTNSTS